MTAREIVRRAIRFERPPRVPYFRWDQPGISDIVGAWLEFAGDREPGTKRWTDQWGCIWQTDHTDMGQVVGHPITSAAQYAAYAIPQVGAGGYEAVFRTLRQWPDRYRFAGLGHFFFETLQFLRGFDDLLVELASEPQAVGQLADRLIPFYLGIIDAYAASGVVDGISVNEDLGLQSSLILSPELWRQFFKPRYKIVYDYAHQKGLSVLQHSCGYLLPILPDLVELGVDVLESQQLNCMGIAAVADVVAGKMAITAPVDIQTVLPTGDRAKIDGFIDQMFRRLATPAGGLIAQTYSACDSLAIPPAVVAYAEINLRRRCGVARISDLKRRPRSR